jgi:WD40 repeat protein
VAIGQQGNSNRCFSVFRMNPAIRDIAVLRDKHDALLGTIRSVALSPDGESVVVSQHFSGYLRTIQTASGQILGSNYSEHAASVSAIAFQPNGKQVATASLDGTVKIWRDLSLQTVETSLVGHAEEVTDLVFAGEGNQLISSSRDKTVRLWDLDGKTPPAHRNMGGSRIQRARFSPDGLLMAVGGDYRTSSSQLMGPQLKDASTGQVVRSLPVLEGL